MSVCMAILRVKAMYQKHCSTSYCDSSSMESGRGITVKLMATFRRDWKEEASLKKSGTTKFVQMALKWAISTTFPVPCSYWPRQGANSILSPILFQNKIHSSPPTYTL
jgi:hypothetical protein